MNSTTKYLIPFVMVALAWLWVAQCHDPDVRKTALQVQQDQRDDSVHQANERWKAAFMLRDTIRDDSLARLNAGIRVARGEIARLRRGLVSFDSLSRGGRLTEPQPAIARAVEPVGKTAGEAEPAPPADLLGQIAVRDSIISAQDTVIAQQDSMLTLWAAMELDRDDRIAQLESENVALMRSRDAWKRTARGTKFGCAGGPSVTATLSGKVAAGFGGSCGIRF